MGRKMSVRDDGVHALGGIEGANKNTNKNTNTSTGWLPRNTKKNQAKFTKHFNAHVATADNKRGSNTPRQGKIMCGS